VEFGRIDGAWVAGLRAWPALAVALREQLIEVAFAHAAARGKVNSGPATSRGCMAAKLASRRPE
jgi:hypothetical protein